MKRLEGALRTYPWGSRTLLAQLRGTPLPAPQPEAELWFGAHSAAPSGIEDTTLDALIAQDPVAHLGQRVIDEFGKELPFLLKLLAADEPLSIQAHPSRAQAEEGFGRENAAGIALDDPRRNYKDANPKPELIVALTEFEALAGFRPVRETLAFFAALGCDALDRYAAILDPRDEASGLRALFTTLISLPTVTRNELIDDLVRCASALAQREGGDPHGASGTSDVQVQFARMFVRLHEKYPRDVGLLAALLLNYVQLQPGQALFLEAGQPHAYLAGLGVEIMANSDNVLRGGLTSKHVDVPELVKVLHFAALSNPFAAANRSVCADGRTEVVEYELPVTEFRLSRYILDSQGTVRIAGDGPSIVLCTRGEVRAGDELLQAGQAVWIPAADGPVTFCASGASDSGDSSGAELFYARA